MIESDPSDSSDDDYQPILQMAPRPHDREASGSSSSSAPPQPPQTDPTLLVVLEWIRQDQARQAQETAAALAQAQARQEGF